ncbi:MAG TPA: glutaredoxin family protein [Candidatus Paceibacterota bacterium]
MKKVSVYSTPTCSYCKMTKEFLAQHNVPFESIDVSADEAKKNEMVERSGQMGVPVIDIEGELIVGFDEERLKELLAIEA